MKKVDDDHGVLQKTRGGTFAWSKTLFLSFSLMFISVCSVFAQKEKVNVSLKNVSLKVLLQELQKQTGFNFVYSPEQTSNLKSFSVEATDQELDAVLKKVFAGRGLTYAFEDRMIVLRQIQQQKAESVKVSGTVKDSRNKPLPGVTILVKGTALGCVSDSDGKYALNFPLRNDMELIFSFIGMETKTVKYFGQQPLNVVLEDAITQMEDVIITGYQNVKKHEMVGSVERVKGDELFNNGNQSIEQMLQGQIAGMSVINTSGMVGTRQKVRIRGTSSILGNQEPVWVVDGMIQEDPLPFKTSEFSALGQIRDDNIDVIKDFVGGAISWLNPSDIENITVLKDAAATVMYGVKAANGVIVITTKKGKSGRMSVNLSAKTSVTPRVNYKNMELMNSKQRIDVSREVIQKGLTDISDLADIGYEGAYKDYVFNRISYDEFNRRVDRMETVNTDWFDILFCNAFSQNYTVGISGGSDRFTYRASLRANLRTGTAKDNDQKSYSGSINISTWLKQNRVKLDARLNANYMETDAFYQLNPYQYASITSRAIPCYNEDGSLYYYAGIKGSPFMFNILHEKENTGNSNTSSAFNGSFVLTWNILEGLKYTSTFGIGVSHVNGETFATEESYYITKNYRGYNFGEYLPNDTEYQMSKLPHGGILSTDNNRNVNYTWRNQLDYNLVLNDDHRLNFIFSHEVRSSAYKGYANTLFGYLPGRGKTIMMPPTVVDSGYGEKRGNSLYDSEYRNVITDRKNNTLSFLLNLSYSFKERYVFNASARIDASNKFGESEKSRRLPVWSVGFRWNIAEESWLKNTNIFNELSFKTSYGWQGNVAENFGPELITKIPYDPVDKLTGEYLLAIKSLPYTDLRWEKTETINLGLDMGFLKNRLMASINYYYKKTSDLITLQPIPYEFGMLNMPVNQGDMENSGYELSLTIVPVRTSNFVWNLNFNTAKNKNKIKSKISTDYSWRIATQGGLLKEGYAYSSFWAFEMSGLDENGLPKYIIPSIDDVDTAEDPSNWMQHVGKLEPDFTGGLNTIFRYKTLTLSASFNISVGGKKFLAPAFADKGGVPDAYTNLPKELVNRWRKPGDETFTDIPVLPSNNISSMELPNGEYGRYHSMYNYTVGRVVNASFMRCNNINLGYTFPQRILKNIGLKGVSIDASVTNPFVIVSKDYHGKDPEVAIGAQPIPRSYTLGINISL